MAETFQEIIFDLGSTFTKIGIPDSSPESIIPTIASHFPNKSPSELTSMGLKNYYVGDEVFSKQYSGHIKKYPVQRGLIENWNYAEKIISHAIFNEARRDPTEIGLMILEHPMTPSSARKKLASYLVEDLSVSAFFFVNPATSAMAATGIQTGVVLCSGGQTTYSMAVKDGKGIISSLMTLDIGREDVLESMAKSLTDNGRGNFTKRGDKILLNDVLEKHGYIALDYDQEMQKAENEFNVPYEMPDGQILHFQHDIFKHNEVLFKPDLIGLERDGIHSMIHATIQKCDPSIHSTLYNNIVLAGGNTVIPGLEDRLKKELQILEPKYSNFIRFRNDFDGLSDKKNRLFRGASFFSATPQCRNHLWISRYDYDEGSDLDIQNPLGLW